MNNKSPSAFVGMASAKAPAKSDPFGICPAHWMLRQFSDRWSLQILSALQASPRRFTELQEDLDPISHRVLGQTLKKLVHIGIVAKSASSDTSAQVRYALTELGRSIIEPLNQLIHWAHDHRDTIDAIRARQAGQ